MTLKEEAKELVDKFRKHVDCDLSGEDGFEYSKDAETYNAKQCALISIDLIIKIETNFFTYFKIITSLFFSYIYIYKVYKIFIINII
jgi:hypothetical protein